MSLDRTGLILTELRRAARRLAALALATFFLLLTGALVALRVFERYQPLEAMNVIGSFSIGLVVLWGVVVWKVWTALRHPEHWSRARRGLLLPGLVPWAFAGFLWLNAVLDQAPASKHGTVVVAKHISRLEWFDAFRYEVVVRSWRPGREYEGVLVREREHFEAYRRGDAVVVEVRRGFFSLAWIEALTKRE